MSNVASEKVTQGRKMNYKCACEAILLALVTSQVDVYGVACTTNFWVNKENKSEREKAND